MSADASSHTTIKGLKTPAADLDGSQLRIAIVQARWNHIVTDLLVAGVRKSLERYRVRAANIVHITVPGSFELPFATAQLIKSAERFDAVIPVGVLIKGETMHFEYIADSVSHALQRLNAESGTPVIFGVLTVLREEQAFLRAGCGDKGHNHGEDWGAAAVEMALLKQAFPAAS